MAGLLLVMAGSACGRAAETPSSTPTPEEPETSLTFTVTEAQGATPKSADLICPGDTPDAESACAALEQVAPDVFEPIAGDQVCTQIYGGEQTATVTGTWDGDDVEAAFSRENGCEIGRWDQINPTLKVLGLQ